MASPVVIVQFTPSSSPKIINSNIHFTEISGYSRSELLGKELSLIAPNLFVENDTNCINFSAERHENEGFIKNKSNSLVPITY